MSVFFNIHSFLKVESSLWLKLCRIAEELMFLWVGKFLIAIFYFEEEFELGHAVAFSLIWVALFIYSFEGISKELNKEGISVSTLSKKIK